MRLIDADALIKDWHFGTSCNSCERDAYKCQNYETYSAMDVCGMIEDAPTIDAVPVKHGKWIDVEHAPNDMWYCTCSVCGERQTVEVANFCPMCGADMRGKENG